MTVMTTASTYHSSRAGALRYVEEEQPYTWRGRDYRQVKAVGDDTTSYFLRPCRPYRHVDPERLSTFDTTWKSLLPSPEEIADFHWDDGLYTKLGWQNAVIDAWYWNRLIVNPPGSDLFQWPQDAVTVNHVPDIVLPASASDGFVPAARMLANINDHPRVRDAQCSALLDKDAASFTAGIVDLWERAEECGYILGGLSLEDLWYRQDDPSRVRCEFGYRLPCRIGEDCRSTIALRTPMPGDDDLETVIRLAPTGEYVDPRVWRQADGNGGILVLDMESQRFTFTAMLFRLLIGRMPYDGHAITTDWAGNTKDGQQHAQWVHAYQNHPVFIFNPDDDANLIGGPSAPADDEPFVDNWERLPTGAKSAFMDMFGPDAFRRAHGPGFWKRLLRDIGVIKGYDMKKEERA